MASAKLLVCLSFALFGSCAGDVCLYLCSLTGPNYSTCKKNTEGRYILSVPDTVPVECMETCELGWYNKNNTLLVNPQNPTSSILPDFIKSVSLWNLTTYKCLDGVYFQMDCHCKEKYVITFKENFENEKRNDRQNGTNKKQLFHILWLLCIPVLVALLVK